MVVVGWLVGGVEDQFNSVVRSVDFYSDSRLRLPQTPLADRSVRRLAAIAAALSLFRLFSHLDLDAGDTIGGSVNAVRGAGVLVLR